MVRGELVAKNKHNQKQKLTAANLTQRSRARLCAAFTRVGAGGQLGIQQQLSLFKMVLWSRHERFTHIPCILLRWGDIWWIYFYLKRVKVYGHVRTSATLDSLFPKGFRNSIVCFHFVLQVTAVSESVTD